MPIDAKVFLFARPYHGDAASVGAAVIVSTLRAAPVPAILLPLLPMPPR